MKNILAIIILLSFLSCSNQKKAEEIIRKNIESQTVNGYTYNALIFSKLSDALSNIKDEEKYKSIKVQYDKAEYNYIYDSIACHESYITDSINYGKAFADINKTSPSAVCKYEYEKYKKELQSLKDKYKPYSIGKGLVHIYICNTPFGDSLYYSRYVFDDEMKIKKQNQISFPIDTDSISEITQRIKNRKKVDIELNDNLWFWSF